MDSNNEYTHREFWNYEVSPFDDSIIEGDELTKLKRTRELLAKYGSSAPDDDEYL